MIVGEVRSVELPDHPLVRDSLDARLDRLMAALRAYDPECVYLVGSAARDEADELSDLDIVVIKRTEAPFLDRLQELAALLPGGVGGGDVLVYTPEEFATMRRDGNAFAEMIVAEGPSPLWRPRGSLRPRAGTDRRPTI